MAVNFGSKRIVVGAHYGLRDWLSQRVTAGLMALFTLVAGAVFHAFWNAAPEQLMVQQIMFMKNLAIAGGLLALTAFGPGALSLDAKRGT